MYIFCLHCQLNTKIQKLPQMQCYKIVHIAFQCERNYIVLTILQISVKSRTRAADIV